MSRAPAWEASWAACTPLVRNAAEVREMVKSIDWDQVISGQVPFDDLAFRRKEEAHEYPSTLEFGLHKGLQFPSGFNSGQQVDLILDHIALPYSEIQSFNELPIPFACVAADLVTASNHVFRSGPLDVALRSTMSLPGIFIPVRYQGHIFVDGGLLDNIPIDVAREMGADFLLGIHLEVAPITPDEPMSSFAVLGRSISVMIAANENRSKPLADLLVIVPLDKYTAMDYNDQQGLEFLVDTKSYSPHRAPPGRNEARSGLRMMPRFPRSP